MLFNQFIAKAVGLAAPAVPSISMALNVLGGAGALHVLTQTGVLGKCFDGVKYVTINLLPTRVALNLAVILPIGSWFEHEIAFSKEVHTTSLMSAVKRDDEALLDKILKYISKKALYRFLCANDWLDQSPLHHATDIFNDVRAPMMQKMILAIEPADRCAMLKKIHENNEPYMFHVLAKFRNEKDIAFVMDAIPENDRFEFLSQLDQKGNSLFIYQAALKKPLSEVKTLLGYVPSHQLVQLLNVTNSRDKTALICFADDEKAFILDYVLGLIPKDKLDVFFAYENQGLRAMLYANTVKNSRATFEVLTRYGLNLSEEEKNISREDLKKLEMKTVAQEAFKQQIGVYPQDILGLLSHNPSEKEIVTAYRKKMLQQHPDKQLNNDDSQAKTLNLAYEFFTKEEARASYLSNKR